MVSVLLCLSPFSFEAGSLTGLGAMLAASKPQWSSCHCLSSEITGMCAIPDFSHGFWGYEFRFFYSKFSYPLSHLSRHEALDTNPWGSYTKLAPRAEVENWPFRSDFFVCLFSIGNYLELHSSDFPHPFLPSAGKQRFLLSSCILIFESLLQIIKISLNTTEQNNLM